MGHKFGNSVEVAYIRGDLLEERARLLRDWADYLDGTEAKIIPLRRT